MRIERIDPADDDVIRGCHAVHVAAQAADDPQGQPADSLVLFRARLTANWGGDPAEAWYVPADSPELTPPGGPVSGGPAVRGPAVKGGGPAAGGSAVRGDPAAVGTVAAWCQIQLPDLENRDRAWVMPVVHPALRRRGIGRALIRHAQARAVAEGRGFLDSGTIQDSAGAAFARRLGAEFGLLDERRVIDLRKVPAGRFAELQAEAARHADGYTLTSWTGATPQAELGRVAGVMNAMNDAPREAWLEDDVWDADRVRTRHDNRVRLAGNRGYAVAAAQDATGEMAALTQVYLDPAEPAWGYQGITAVTRPHRGHRLGLLVKAAMLDWLTTAEPQLERIETTNSATNSYMISVNEALGFELAAPGFEFYALPAR